MYNRLETAFHDGQFYYTFVNLALFNLALSLIMLFQPGNLEEAWWFYVCAVKVPLDAYMMDFVFSESENGGVFDNKFGMDYHIPVFGSIVKEPPLHIIHIAVEMAPIAKVS